MNLLLIDDEKSALAMLEYYLLNEFEWVNILAKLQNAVEAVSVIENNQVDLIFCDIEMPHLNGLDFAKIVESKSIPIVFVTAHMNYAIEALRLQSFDYLLKPVNVKELHRVMNRYLETKQDSRKKIEFKISNRIIVANKETIIFVKSEGNYSTVYFADRPSLILTKNMKKMMDEFFGSDDIFFRSHRSYMVNRDHIIEFNNYQITLSNGEVVPLSKKNFEILRDKMSRA